MSVLDGGRNSHGASNNAAFEKTAPCGGRFGPAFGGHDAQTYRLINILDGEQSRWFLWLPVFLGLGIGGYFALPFEPGVSVFVPCLIIFLALGLFRRRSIYAVLISGALITLILGFSLAKLRTELVRAPKIIKTSGVVEVVGWVERIENISKARSKTRRLLIRVVAVDGIEAKNLPEHVRIFEKSRKRNVPVGDVSVGEISLGDYVRTAAILRPPPSPSQPGGYDFARTAWFQKLGGVGYSVKGFSVVEAKPALSWRLWAWVEVERLRANVGERISSHLTGEAGAVARALLTGDRSQISEKTKTALRHSGLAHILAISGLHMAVMSGAVFWLVRAFLALSRRLVLTQPIKKWSALVAIFGALFYLVLSGASPATQRAFIMVVLLYVAVLLDRPALSLRNVAVAALVILVIWPESLINIGFQMSFAAVTSLIAFYEVWNGRRLGPENPQWAFGISGRIFYFFIGIALTTIVAGIAIAPLSAYHFGREAGYSLIANLGALPVFSFVVMPMALVSLVSMPFGLEQLPLQLMGRGVEIIVAIASWVSNLPGAVIYIAEVPLYALVMVVFGGLWLLLWQLRWRYLGLFAIGFGLAFFQASPKPDIYIGDNARTIAVRNLVGGHRETQLSAPKTSRRSYLLKRWLEKDGDARPARVAAKGVNFRCDFYGCVTRVKDYLVVHNRNAAGLDDDCQRADILIARLAIKRPCLHPKLIIDKSVTTTMGAHVVYIDGDRFRVESVETRRGRRPWSRNPPE